MKFRGVCCRVGAVFAMAVLIAAGRVEASPHYIGNPILPIDPAMDDVRDRLERVDLSLRRLDMEEAELGWADPSLNGDVSFTMFDSDAPGGLDGEQWDLNASIDADVCNGLLVGLSYGFASRDGDATGTDESMDSNTFGLYVAKRFMDWLNVGGSFAWTHSNHEITGAGATDLDNNTFTYTGFVGASKQWEDLFGSLTASLSYNDMDPTPGRFQTWVLMVGPTLSYDLSEEVALGFTAWWNHVLDEDATGDGNRNSFIFGPRLDWFLNEDISINVSYRYLWGPDNFDGHELRAGAGFLF